MNPEAAAETSSPTPLDLETLQPGKIYKLYDTTADKWELVKFAGIKTSYSVMLYPNPPVRVPPITGSKESVDKQLQLFDIIGVQVPIEAASSRKEYTVHSAQYNGKAAVRVTKYEIPQVYKKAAAQGKFTNNAVRPMKFDTYSSHEFYPISANIGNNHYALPKLTRNTFRNNAWNRRSHLVADRYRLTHMRSKPAASKTRKARKYINKN